MDKLLHRLLYKHKISLHAEKTQGSESVWVLRSTKEKEDFHCAFKVEEDLDQQEIIDFYIQPAIVSLENMRNVEISAKIQPKRNKMANERYISIDIETTGLDPETCQILEIGAIIEDGKSPIEELPTFQCYVKHSMYCGEPYALAMNSKIFEKLAGTKSLVPFCGNTHRLWNIIEYTEVIEHFTEWLESNSYQGSITAAGKNFGSFDLQFLKLLPGFQQLAPHFRHRYIDPAILYWEPSVDGFALPDLITCLTRAGIPEKVTHTALEDATLVIKLIRHYYAVKGKWDMR